MHSASYSRAPSCSNSRYEISDFVSDLQHVPHEGQPAPGAAPLACRTRSLRQPGACDGLYSVWCGNCYSAAPTLLRSGVRARRVLEPLLSSVLAFSVGCIGCGPPFRTLAQQGQLVGASCPSQLLDLVAPLAQPPQPPGACATLRATNGFTTVICHHALPPQL